MWYLVAWYVSTILNHITSQKVAAFSTRLFIHYVCMLLVLKKVFFFNSDFQTLLLHYKHVAHIYKFVIRSVCVCVCVCMCVCAFVVDKFM
jgi:hypothetical protein